MSQRSEEYFPKYRLTNLKTNELWEARGLRRVLQLAGLSTKTPSAQIHKLKKWKLEEIEPPLKWDQQAYRRELYKNTKDRYKVYEAKKLAADPLYERRKKARLRKWKNTDGTQFTAEQHEEMLLLPCSICKTNGDVVVDHNHDTNVVRGTLCRKCNLTLGLVSENVELLREMVDYLLRTKEN